MTKLRIMLRGPSLKATALGLLGAGALTLGAHAQSSSTMGMSATGASTSLETLAKELQPVGVAVRQLRKLAL